MRHHLLAAAGAAFLALSAAPASALPGGGAAGVQMPDSNLETVQWYEDRGWRRRGPPPWAYGRRHRDGYGWRGDYGPRRVYGGYGGYRGYGYRGYDRPYRRPGVVFRFGY